MAMHNNGALYAELRGPDDIDGWSEDDTFIKSEA